MSLEEKIAPPDSHHLSAAIGWLGLGDWREAIEELKKIAPEFQHHLDVSLVRYDIFARAEDWGAADGIVHELMELQPKEAQFWIWHAYAVRRMPGGGLTDAKKILVQAAELFEDEPLIRFNLACYECQLGDLAAAWNWLVESFRIGESKTLKLMALQDRDLEPLWAQIRQHRPV